MVTVDAPTAKAAKSVIDVMVMLTPACLIVIPMRLGSDLFESSLLRLFQPVKKYSLWFFCGDTVKLDIIIKQGGYPNG